MTSDQSPDENVLVMGREQNKNAGTDRDVEGPPGHVRFRCGPDRATNGRIGAKRTGFEPDETAKPTCRRSAIGPGTQLGDFRVERRIGTGGMGVVYQARPISLNRAVALKVLPPGLGWMRSAVVQFRREAQAAGKLHHTTIVAIYAEGEEGGTCYYAMELIEGRGLDQIIANLRGVPVVGSSGSTLTFGPGINPPSDASHSTFRLSSAGVSESGSDREHFDTIARWMADAADALDYAHQQEVIHLAGHPRERGVASVVSAIADHGKKWSAIADPTVGKRRQPHCEPSVPPVDRSGPVFDRPERCYTPGIRCVWHGRADGAVAHGITAWAELDS